MNWYKAESTERPPEQDLTSSRKYNYVRRNIEEEERETEDGGTITMYVYEEVKIPKESWGLYLDTEQNKADIEYIAVMSDIDLEG